MRRILKSLFLTVIGLVAALGIIAGYYAYKYYQLYLFPDISVYEDIEQRVVAARKIVGRRGLSQKYCFFLDYSIPSGTPRLFVWDFEEEKIVVSTYAMHGSGGGSTDEKPVFSDRHGSHCSSLGRFAVTHQHGTKNKSGYFLRGLDFSNRTARARGLMIHKSRWVDANCWRRYIPLNSRSCMGCVTISSRGMDYIGRIMKGEQKEILLWSYE